MTEQVQDAMRGQKGNLCADGVTRLASLHPCTMHRDRYVA